MGDLDYARDRLKRIGDIPLLGDYLDSAANAMLLAQEAQAQAAIAQAAALERIADRLDELSGATDGVPGGGRYLRITGTVSS